MDNQGQVVRWDATSRVALLRIWAEDVRGHHLVTLEVEMKRDLIEAIQAKMETEEWREMQMRLFE